MYTVIIAERPFIDLCEELRVFLEPLMLPDIVFCEWNRSGENLEEMLPDLKKLTEFHEEWRAIIVNQDRLKQVNPFDFTGYKDAFYGPAPGGNMELIRSRRAQRIDSFERATENPLTRLTTALTGIPTYSYLLEDDITLESLLSGEMDLRVYMLQTQLDNLNLQKTAGRLNTSGKEALLSFVPESQAEALIAAVRDHDLDFILQSVDLELLPSFISLLSDGDLLYADVDYNEGLLENTVKNQILHTLSSNFTLKDTLPTEVICFAPRTCIDHPALRLAAEKTPDHFDYSKFAEYNLYHEKIKFLLYDLIEPDSNLYATDQMKMVTCLLILAGNQIPVGSLVPSNVYAFQLDMDREAMKATFQDYLGKLKATGDLILETSRELDRRAAMPLDNETSRRLFEQDIRIPVEINEYKRSDFYVKAEKLGLSTDCPDEELTCWNTEYRKVEKEFVRFLREPLRALKASVSGEFRTSNRIEDERVFRLNENQREDVNIKMLEEEGDMVRINTPGLLNEAEYKKQLKEADREVKRAISKRMTKTKTLIFGGIALGVYLAGFLPLFFSATNTPESFLSCFLLTVVALAVLAGAGFGFLVLMRRRLKERILHFNYVISGIFSQIESSLSTFSAYLGHACNFMRSSSVLHTDDSDTEQKKRVLAHHLNAVNESSERAIELFSRFIDCNQLMSTQDDPYPNDYTVMGNYEYPVPFRLEGRSIEYVQPGHYISIPTDFVTSISMNRVELYD